MPIMLAVGFGVLFEMWLDAWIFGSVDGVRDRGIPQFPFDDSIDCFAKVSHTCIHAIGVSLKGSIPSQTWVGAKSET